MSQLIDKLEVKERLNLELVKARLKPASLISFGGAIFPFAYDAVFEGVYVKDLKIQNEQVKLLPEIISQFESELTEFGVHHQENFSNSQTTYLFTSPPKPVFLELKIYAIAHSTEKLNNLLNAKSHEEKGLALGFPKEDVESYHKIINGQERDGIYLCKSLGEAIKANVQVPSWLAYISFIPQHLDIVNGNISVQSEELGKKYQAHIRKNNKTLAEEVEQEFLRERDSLIRYV
ncbi:MAG: hypothetical protein ACLFN8_04225 [Candidatus Woesearchaeota archaeon]